MADFLRYLRPNAAPPGLTPRPYRSVVDGLSDPEDEPLTVAPPNASGILEREMRPYQQGEQAAERSGRFQLRDPMTGLNIEGASEPGDLRMPGELNAPRQQLTPPMSGANGMTFVEGLPPVERAPEPRAQKSAGAMRIPGMDADAADRAAAERAQRARRGIGIVGIISALFGDSRTADQRNSALAAAARSNDPSVPLQRIEARHAQQAEAARAAEEQEYERQFAERRLGLEERRIAQAEGATSQDVDRQAAMYDPEHPAAQSARIAYARMYRAIPPAALPQLSAFQPDASMRGMSAMDVRQQAAGLMQAWGRLQQANPNLFRVGRRGGGSGERRGQLAGFGEQRAGRDYGVSEGLTREDYAALGVDPAQFGIEEDPAMPMDAPSVAQPGMQAPPVAPSGAPRPRAQGGGMRAAPAQAQPMAAPQGAPAQAVPQGRPLVDRPMTEAERATASMDERTTEAAVRAYMNQHAMRDYAAAAARVNGLTPDQRGQLIREWGNEEMSLVPGWQRMRDTGALTPARLTEMREIVDQERQVRAGAQRILNLTAQINALNLAEDEFSGHPLVARWRSEARRIQTALRMIDRTGVPTGNEQERAMQEAPEPDSLRALLRAGDAYGALPTTLAPRVGIYMQQQGYAPVRRQRQGGQQR
jgi:hypothetical protein